jgi:hypothetical protein
MTDKEAMAMALDALNSMKETLAEHEEPTTFNEDEAITALKERLAQEKALQALHNENERLGLYKDAYAQPEQEPVGFVQQSVLDWLYSMHRFSSAHTITTIAKSPTETEDIPLYATPPQRTEENFCSRCGKRTPDSITIHTCTPPKENT